MKKPAKVLRFLAVGDIVGRPGRRLLAKALPILKTAFDCDTLIVNVENAAGGFGLTREIYQEFEDMNIDVMTSGNHIFDKKGYHDWFPWAPKLLRPENFPPGTVGKGYDLFETADGTTYAVVNLIGRVFMKTYDCPFRAADAVLEEIAAKTPIILVDFHAEATSEKQALGWYLARRISALWGTHTHVPTADGRILEGFTGYLTDLGMTGAHDSVIGMTKEPVIHGFLTLERSRFEVAKADPRIGCCFFDIEPESGRCVDIKSFFLTPQQLENIKNGTT